MCRPRRRQRKRNASDTFEHGAARHRIQQPGGIRAFHVVNAQRRINNIEPGNSLQRHPLAHFNPELAFFYLRAAPATIRVGILQRGNPHLAHRERVGLRAEQHGEQSGTGIIRRKNIGEVRAIRFRGLNGGGCGGHGFCRHKNDVAQRWESNWRLFFRHAARVNVFQTRGGDA